jgi:acetyl esterase/lipase
VRAWLTGIVLLAAACGTLPPKPGASAPSSPVSEPGRKPGDLLSFKEMKGAPTGSKAWRILYVSTGIDGRTVETSGVVVAPDQPNPLGGRPVVAWAHGTTGVEDDCAPSRAEHFFERIPHLPALIALDYVVVATDYEGLGTPGVHPYLVGLSEARSVLDSVRAAGNLKQAGAGRRFIVWGHSEGGHAALFTGQRAQDHAPELHLEGVAAISPPTDLEVLLDDDLSERAGRILGAYALWSWSQVYKASLDLVVKPAYIPTIEKTARDCIETEVEGFHILLDSLDLPKDMLVDGAFAVEPWKGLIEENRPGRSPIPAPIYIAQGTEDDIVRASVTADFVKQLCASGATVRYDVLPGVNHLRSARVSATAAVQWIRDRFNGDRAPNTCVPPSYP